MAKRQLHRGAMRTYFAEASRRFDFHDKPNLAFADTSGRIVTAGGATSWHDLAIHIIARHCTPGEALHVAKVHYLQLHGQGQLPFANLVRRQPHAGTQSCAKPKNGLPIISAPRMRSRGSWKSAAFRSEV